MHPILENFDVEGQVWDAIEIYCYKHNAFRSYSNTTIINKPDNKKVKTLVTEYMNTPQLEQRSKEWFEFRRSGLSASDIWKAIDSQSMQNSLIYSKCKRMYRERCFYFELLCFFSRRLGRVERFMIAFRDCMIHP